MMNTMLCQHGVSGTDNRPINGVMIVIFLRPMPPDERVRAESLSYRFTRCLRLPSDASYASNTSLEACHDANGYFHHLRSARVSDIFHKTRVSQTMNDLLTTNQ